MKYFPSDYYYHPKAWMNQAIFHEWFFIIFVLSVTKFQDEKGLPKKADLLLDNAPSHPSSLASNVRVVQFLSVIYHLT